MAQTLARRRWKTSVRVESAGFSRLASAGLAPDPVVLRVIGARSRHRSRHLDKLDLERFDLFVAMDDGVAIELVEHGVPVEKLVIWDFADPDDYSLESYKILAEQMVPAIEQLEAELRSTGFLLPSSA